MDQLKDQQGAILTEFAIMTPIAVLTLALMMHLVFYYNAKVITRYAAFCAARTAIVETENVENRMKRSAMVPLASISNTIGQELAEFTNILNRHTSNTDIDPLNTFLSGMELGGNALNGLLNDLDMGGNTFTDILQRLPVSYYRTIILDYGPVGANYQVTLCYLYDFGFPLQTFMRFLGQEYNFNLTAQIQSNLDAAGITLPDNIAGLTNDLEQFYLPVVAQAVIPRYSSNLSHED